MDPSSSNPVQDKLRWFETRMIDARTALEAATAQGREADSQAMTNAIEKLSCHHNRLQQADKIFEKHGLGTILKHQSMDKWIVLLPDVSEPGQYRHQTFTAESFSAHATFPTMGAALVDAALNGYCISDQSALDRLSREPEWQRGVQYLDTVRRLGRREIDTAAANAEFEQSQKIFVKAILQKIATDETLSVAIQIFASTGDASLLTAPGVNEKLAALLARLPRSRLAAPHATLVACHEAQHAAGSVSLWREADADPSANEPTCAHAKGFCVADIAPASEVRAPASGPQASRKWLLLTQSVVPVATATLRESAQTDTIFPTTPGMNP